MQRSLSRIGAVGPNEFPSHMPTRPDVIPSCGGEEDEDDLSEATNEKPMGIEEFKQRVEQTHKAELRSQKKKSKK